MFFEPPVKMVIGFQKLGVQRIREILSFVLCIELSLHCLVEKAQGEIIKIQWLQGKENKFQFRKSRGSKNQDSAYTVLVLI